MLVLSDLERWETLDLALSVCFYVLPITYGSCGSVHVHSVFLGRLPKVDLIILEGGKMSVRPSVRPQKVSSI